MMADLISLLLYTSSIAAFNSSITVLLSAFNLSGRFTVMMKMLFESSVNKVLYIACVFSFKSRRFKTHCCFYTIHLSKQFVYTCCPLLPPFVDAILFYEKN